MKLNLSHYFCELLTANGQHLRYLQLDVTGKVNQLSGYQSDDREVSWEVKNGVLVFQVKNKSKKLNFNLKNLDDFKGGFFLTGLSSLNNERFTLMCVEQKTDLFERKTKILNRHDIKSGKLTVGDHTYGKVDLIDVDDTLISIGNYCSIAGQVTLIGANHRTDLVTTYPFKVLNPFFSHHPVVENDHISKGEIKIGHDVWIGMRATIMHGVTIGDGAVIAANSMVTKDVEPYSIVAGSPARHIKYRIDNAEQRQKMQQIAWWNWSEELIAERINKIMSSDIDAFIAEFSGK